MAHLHQNKNIKTLIVYVFKESAGLDGVWGLHKYHIRYFELHFSYIGSWGCPNKGNNAMLGILLQKSENDIAKHH